jgi:hypothetical protein
MTTTFGGWSPARIVDVAVADVRVPGGDDPSSDRWAQPESKELAVTDPAVAPRRIDRRVSAME